MSGAVELTSIDFISPAFVKGVFKIVFKNYSFACDFYTLRPM